MSRKGKVFFGDLFTGIISETEEGYTFIYEDEYLSIKENQPISLTFPKAKKEYFSKSMFPFFDGLIPEGWLLNIAIENWKLDSRDRMGLLLSTCKDCIGAVSVVKIEDDNE
ncbi:MAG: HipA N-terminal domain-containing protein [Melioribacteraceae bacterium]|nr:HipA N-terminal domain-containing protein [Melioribacteraceae bacterium]